MTNQTNEILIQALPRITKALEEISRKLPEHPALTEEFQNILKNYASQSVLVRGQNTTIALSLDDSDRVTVTPEPPEDSLQASIDRYHKFLSEGFTPETIETLPPDIQEAIKGHENILKRPTQK